MKIGLLTVAFGDEPRAKSFQYCASIGLDAVELGTGEFSSAFHVPKEALEGDERAIHEIRDDADQFGLEISGLAAHSNPLHPDPRLAGRADRNLRQSIALARALGVANVVVFSGCPGTPEGDVYPNWVTTSWPTYFHDLNEWQWNQRVIPYWSELAQLASDNGVRLAVEMHPGNSAYNTETLLRLRESCGEAIGANFDPSHLWWQGIDPLVSLAALGEAGAIFHVHAKDTIINGPEMARDGGLTTKEWDQTGRPWRFITVGYGHDLLFWRQFVVALRIAGYDGVLSIEHEDPLAAVHEPLERTVRLLSEAIWREQGAGLQWFPSVSGLAEGDNYASPLARSRPGQKGARPPE